MKSNQNNKTIFRLRVEDEIVGYLMQKGSYTFYSADMFGWNGAELNYHLKDVATEFLDINRKRIFENDIIEITDQPENYYIVTYDALINKFYLVDYQTKRIFEKDFDEILVQHTSFKRVSYTFRNN